MKIAFPTIDTDKNRNILANSLNVNGCICLYDCEHNDGKWMKTMDLAANMGDLLPELIRRNVNVIVTGQIHPMALKVLVNKGFEVLRAESELLDENLRFYNEKRLVPYSYDNAMALASVCGGECNGCETECKTEN